jgi:hypothetical protein
MAPNTKPGAERPAAQSVTREPAEEPRPDQPDLPKIDHEDRPKGQPTSDRFQTEQAPRAREKDANMP